MAAVILYTHAFLALITNNREMTSYMSNFGEQYDTLPRCPCRRLQEMPSFFDLSVEKPNW